jgi:hypothetical protein
VSGADRARLAAIVADRNSPQKHVWRARIILATAEGCGMAKIMRRTCVWCWRGAVHTEGIAGLARDMTAKAVGISAQLGATHLSHAWAANRIGCASSSCCGSAVRRQAA